MSQQTAKFFHIANRSCLGRHYLALQLDCSHTYRRVLNYPTTVHVASMLGCSAE